MRGNSMWRDDASVLDIVKSCRSLMKITTGISYDEFIADEAKLRLAERYFEIIGEASSRLTEEFRSQHSYVPWSAWIGLRNIISHQYHRIDYSKIWELMTTAIPEIESYLTPLVPPKD